MSLKESVQELSEKFYPDVLQIRRHIHANPELSFEEYNTSAYIQQQLDEIGISYQNGVANTGVVALIEGERKSDRVVALRADIDALPIVEANEVSYKSTNEGVMHACGHDVHTSCLLGVSRVLQSIKKDFSGTVKCIFQPAEEKIPGGAQWMIKEGVLENPKPQSVIGQHVHPVINAGTVGFRPGMFMASADEITLTIKGRGGHAAVPTDFDDTILLSSQIVVALQQLVSRLGEPTIPTVLSFGKINSTGGAFNVMPEEVVVQGTLRTMNEEWRAEAHEHIKRIATQTAKASGGACEVYIQKGYPALINDYDLTMRNREAAMEYLGEEKVIDLPMRMTAEDFAYFTQHSTACFYRLGTRNEAKGITSPVHTPTFDIDETALQTGVGVMTWLALKELGNG